MSAPGPVMAIADVRHPPSALSAPPLPARPTMIIYGANDYTAALARAAALLDRHVVVCDARPVFATQERMPAAHQVIVRPPVDHLRDELEAGRADETTAVIVLTHEDRFSLPVLDLALRSGLGYVGAMGSRQTHEHRCRQLLLGSLPPTALQRLHSPIGLDIGALDPAEIAVAILAEMISAETAAGHENIPEGQPNL